MDETRQDGMDERGQDGAEAATWDDRDPMPEDVAPGETVGTGVRNRALWIGAGLLVAFLIGFGWQYIRASDVRSRLATAERELLVERLQVHLARATLAAQGSEFEEARQEMSGFFTLGQENMADLPVEVRDVVREFLTTRDRIITGLSRGEPQYAGILYGMLRRFGEAAESAAAPAPEPGDAAHRSEGAVYALREGTAPSDPSASFIAR